MNAAKWVELPVELPAAIQEVWLALSRCGGSRCVGSKISVSSRTTVHSHRQVLEKGFAILFHRDYNVYVATLFKLLGQCHTFSVYLTNQVRYNIVIVIAQ